MNQAIKNSGFRYKKALGQNFIFDKNLLDAIALDAGICKTDTVLEVGVGAATLTQALARHASRVVAVEIDEDLKPVITQNLTGIDNVTLIFSDILKLTESDIASLTNGGFKVVANLPYYITTPVIFHFLESGLPISSMTLMVQKEVAMRMTASPDTPDYGALSLAVAARANAVITRQISRNMFMPAPNVDSAVVRMDVIRPYNRMISKVIKSLFAMRRKTIVNNLISFFCLRREDCLKILTDAGIAENARGEQLGLTKVTALTKELCKTIDAEFA